jgi:MerR family transcriptional regulator, light-induced transcriptional regulator
MDLREAARTLGVHYQTAYAWVRQGVLPARKLGRGYALEDADVAAFAARRQLGREPEPGIRVRDWASQARGLYEAIVHGEETAARHRLERIARGVRVVDLCEHVVGPALRQIGDDWATGAVTIAQEHRASAICERLLATTTRQPAGRPRGIAVVTTPAGERHGLPALMAAACLREDHWLVHHLSADLPVAEVRWLAGQVGANLVVLSSAMAETEERARQAARSIAASDPRLTVLAGGPGDSLHDLLARAGRARAAAGGAGAAPDEVAGAAAPGIAAADGPLRDGSEGVVRQNGG